MVSSVSVARERTGRAGETMPCENDVVRIGERLLVVVECSVVDEARARSVVAYKFLGSVAKAVADRALECLGRRTCTALGDGDTLSTVEQLGKRTVRPGSACPSSSFFQPPDSPLEFSGGRRSASV